MFSALFDWLLGAGREAAVFIISMVPLVELRKERRLELAFEGQRWFDLVRLDKVEEVMNAVYAKDSGRKAQVYAFDKNSYRLPIPQSVIDANDKIQQNPGY